MAAAPGQLAGLTAASLDGTGSAVSVPAPGGLADRRDQKFWQTKLRNATVTDAPAPATGTGTGTGTVGHTFALLTTNGGALVFYTDSAELTIIPPTGSGLRLTVPGFYSPADPLTRAPDLPGPVRRLRPPIRSRRPNRHSRVLRPHRQKLTHPTCRLGSPPADRP